LVLVVETKVVMEVTRYFIPLLLLVVVVVMVLLVVVAAAHGILLRLQERLVRATAVQLVINPFLADVYILEAAVVELVVAAAVAVVLLVVVVVVEHLSLFRVVL
jgi:hypothetical protein